jgi:hypothetical protein
MSDIDVRDERVQRGREIIARVRELEAEDKARYEAFAATIKSRNKKFIHRRDPAAKMVATAINAPYSSELLRRSNCPFVVISRIAYYAEDDLRELAEGILNSAPLRRGTPDRRRRKPARRQSVDSATFPSERLGSQLDDNLTGQDGGQGCPRATPGPRSHLGALDSSNARHHQQAQARKQGEGRGTAANS